MIFASEVVDERIKSHLEMIQSIRIRPYEVENPLFRVSESDKRTSAPQSLILATSDLSRANLHDANLSEADLSRAILTGAKLVGAYLGHAKLSDAKLSGADLGKADLHDTTLFKADLDGANLREAILTGSDLRKATLPMADLSRAKLSDADLSGADLHTAVLTGADLSRAALVETNLESAVITGCRIYGISAWNVRLSEGTKQRDLVITREGEPDVTIDNIEVAQFVYLLLHNEKIRDVIDTVGRKGVLLLGRFTEGRIAVLEQLREELRRRG
jgi:hypothetical protein